MEQTTYTKCKFCLLSILRNNLITLVIFTELIGAEYSNKHSNLRLPMDVIPVDYKIQLIPFLQDGNFTTNGRVQITLRCDHSTNVIMLNTNNLTILPSTVKLRHAYDLPEYPVHAELIVANQTYNKEKQIYSITVYPALTEATTYELYMDFVSELNDILQGFYRSKYIDLKSKQKRWLATTQFSPTEARRAFPCWDEPAFKASFTIIIGRPKNMSSLSNMPVKETLPIEGMDNWVWDHYYTTLPMSTYLVAFIVSDLKSLGIITLQSGLKFQVFSRSDVLQQTRYALEIGPKILMYFEDYFNIKYPLPKLDLAAIPDFGFTGMENWGLITFRESGLLYDISISSLQDKQRVALVTGHELAHQWFGNLVTPSWWDDVWLKEGFATYIGLQAVDYVEPTWLIKMQFVIDTLHAALVIDSLLSSHQISVQIEDPKDITQIFDGISYAKGASIIRMMSHFLSEDNFKTGITQYLLTYQYKNANQNQLWDVLTGHIKDSSLPQGITIKDIMDSWTLQAGYPVVTVQRDYNNKTVLLTQERFLLSGKRNKSDSLWWIPISYTAQAESDFNNTQPRVWMKNTESYVTFSGIDSSQWLLVNLHHTGYFRVNYDERNWAMLADDFHNLPELIRGQLLNDALSLARAGLLNYSLALNLTTKLINDDSYSALAAVKREAYYVHNMLIRTPVYEKLKAYILKVLKVDSMNLSLNSNDLPNDHLARVHRVMVINTACRLEYPPIVEQVRRLTDSWLQGATLNVGPDLKQAAYCTAVAHGNSSVWQYFWNEYTKSNSPSDREVYLAALGCTMDTTILTRYINMLLDESSGIRKQDGTYVFKSVAENKYGYEIAFNFLSNEWDNLQNYFGLGFRRISLMVSFLSIYLNTQEQLDQLKMIQLNHSQHLGSTDLSLNQTIEEVTNSVAWIQAYYSEINKWLDKESVQFL